jgi:hypothetical protein
MAVVSPHLIRTYTARQLALVSGDDRVVVFASCGGRWAASAVLVHQPTLSRRVADLAPDVHTVVIVDQPLPDAATVSLIDDMLVAFENADVDALAVPAPLTEAVKETDGRYVLAGLDRSSLVSVRCPEVISRSVLARALQPAADRRWVNPTALVCEWGGRVGFYGEVRPLVDGPATPTR